MEALPADELGGYMALGEVALDGALTSVAGVLLAALAAASRGSGVICPAECGGEAAWAGEVEVIAAQASWRSSIISKGPSCCRRPSRGSRRRARPASTSPM